MNILYGYDSVCVLIMIKSLVKWAAVGQY
jgi:hypothetical protein